jgi:hypothetical protein
MIDELVASLFAVRAARAAGLANNATPEDWTAVVRIEIRLRGLLIRALQAESVADTELLVAAAGKGESK